MFEDNPQDQPEQRDKDSDQRDQARSTDPSLKEGGQARADSTDSKESLVDPRRLAEANSDAVEVPFVATRDELLELVRYWANEILHEDWSYFLYGYTIFSNRRHRSFACGRINTIIELLGADTVNTAMEATKNEFGKRCNTDYWRIFNEGTTEERKVVRNEMRTYHPPSKEKMYEFHADLMNVLAGNPSQFHPSAWLGWANTARDIIAQNPELALPVNRDELLSRMEEKHRDIHEQMMEP